MKNLLMKIKDALFHERWTCNVCNKEIFSGYFCEECLQKIEKISTSKCKHCGRVTPYPVNFCDNCIEKNVNFNIARSVFNYEPPISYLIQNFKYKNQKYHKRYFAEELFNLYKSEKLNCDVICFVPMTEERFNQTGYNHAELLSQEFSNLSKIPIVDALQKIKETPRQATLSLSERLKNLKSAFKVKGKLIKDKKVLIIDDVLTTGATCDTISKLLKKNGATKICVLTVASVSKYDKIT